VEYSHALPAAVYTTDAAGIVRYYNRAAVELDGREPQFCVDIWCVSIRLRNPVGSELPLEKCPLASTLKENRSVRGVEALAQRPDGSLCPILPFPTPIRGEDGELLGAVNMLVDITDRKEAETHQKLLLSELNHRVKNNMQMLHGLLRAAERATESPEAQAVLADASQRVAAIAAAQQHLYTTESPHGFDTEGFLRSVCASAQQAFGREVTVKVDAQPGFLSNDVSMPLALIVNELLTNSAKHGLNGRSGGNIDVSLRRLEGQVQLCVEDDGPGFDLDCTGRRSSGLGLVTGLARQLRGTFTVERGPGARCIVCFPEMHAQ
jgi:two-component sensor histidine kinase